jgi:parvulin-like peptidyl-prolyl isomerase
METTLETTLETTSETTQSQPEQEFLPSQIYSATNEDIISYLCRSHQIAEIAAMAERDALVLSMCEQLDITVSDEELQAAGNVFRTKNKLLGASETLAWLQQQRITVEDWSDGIKIALLTNKLKEHLFGDAVDAHYIDNRNDYKRVAISQILVSDLPTAFKLAHELRVENASFCALALSNSQGIKSQQNGGFVGISFVSELMPEIAQAIAKSNVNEIIGPIQTRLGYHIIRIEKWFPVELHELVREQIIESFFKSWLQTNKLA